MQVLSNGLHELYTYYKCEICGEKFNKNGKKDIIKIAHGDIEHDIQENKAFREKMHTIFIHENCLKLVLNNNFHHIWDLLFKKLS